MTNICIVLEYKDFFEDEPKSIDYYLHGISKEILINYAIYYCSLSNLLKPEVENIFWAFLKDDDKGTDYIETLKNKISDIINKGIKRPIILNTRTSLNFFELVKGRESQYTVEIPDKDIRQRLLKVYLLLNTNRNVVVNDNLNVQLVAISLRYSMYSDVNFIHLRLTEIIKSCLFFEFCKEKLQSHLEVFIKDYGLENCMEYTLFLHQIGNLIVDRNIEDPVKLIWVPINDENYVKKINFLDRFCLQEIYKNDMDFTNIKSFPVEKNEETNEYRIVFEQFFIEKIYKSLYFKFNKINDSFKGSDQFIKNFKSNIGLYFSEKVLLNKILKDALGKKYKHLGFDKLQNVGRPDYYIRDGKYILLFECKDNLIKKEVTSSCDVDAFIDEMKLIFLKNKDGKAKAIKQLISNIVTINKGKFTEDKGMKCSSSIIYPIIVTHNNIFSLSGVNSLLNEWFMVELESEGVKRLNIKNLTIVSINTLILFQGVISQKNYSLRELIDSYWKNHEFINRKKYETGEDVVDGYIKGFQSFDSYVANVLGTKNIFTKEILKYSKYFEQKK